MIRMYGHSDDIVYIDGDAQHEIGAGVPVSITSKDPEEGGVVVRLDYVNPGVWEARIRQLAEDLPIPWPVRVSNRHEYSVLVEIDCPHPGVGVTWPHGR